ncbi:unnamed protein product [Ostreobium quekettii]|uniref:NAD-dependent epimerase/dehydratase domain-containing protein n=1 Tax=Ostreobium quekettii TaxID=121088 RepID=A0A8S1J474_9CHLO|nr:unnamed protein product [Ostreobium quekettii]
MRSVVAGTKNVLESVNKTRSVRKVVVTASYAAMVADPDEASGPVGEDSHATSCGPKKLVYFYAKKFAEDLANYMERTQRRWKLVTICPGFTLGPPVATRQDSASFRFMSCLLDGSFWPCTPAVGLPFVDVDDVAAAHCIAAIKEESRGRYCVVARSMYPDDVVRILRDHGYGKSHWLPFLKAPKWLLLCYGRVYGYDGDFVRAWYGKCPEFNNERSRMELGLEYIDLEVSVVDMAERLVASALVEAENRSVLFYWLWKCYSLLLCAPPDAARCRVERFMMALRLTKRRPAPSAEKTGTLAERAMSEIQLSDRGSLAGPSQPPAQERV